MLLLRDSFDAPRDPADPERGLNASLERRQAGALAPARYRRLPGVWSEGAPPAPAEAVGVADGHLDFRGFAAVRLEAPLGPDEQGAWKVTAAADPVSGDDQSAGWLSFILTDAPASPGWVTAPTNLCGLLLRSSGEVQLFSRGEERAARWDAERPTPVGVYAVSLTLRATPGALDLEARINGCRLTAELARGLASAPGPLYLELGAHFHGGDSLHSWLDDLAVYGSPLP